MNRDALLKKFKKVKPLVLTKAMYVLAGVVIIIGAHVFAGVWSKFIVNFVQRKKSEEELDRKDSVAYKVVQLFLYWLVMGIAIVIVLHILGLETASVLALIGSLGFAVGLAMQGALSDVTAGILLSIGGEFGIGDTIQVESIEGIVVGFNLLYTTVQAEDTYHYIKIPNRTLYGAILHNHTRPEVRSFHFNVVVSNVNRDIKDAMRQVEKAIQSHPDVLPEPKVRVQVSGIANNTTELEVRVTIKSENYPNHANRSFMNELLETTRETLIKNDIVLPTWPTITEKTKATASSNLPNRAPTYY